MIQTTEELETYLSHFPIFEKRRHTKEPAWLHPVRQAALESFSRLGFPTTHHEEWRFTSIAPITRVPFRLAEGDGKPLSDETLSRFTFGRWEGIQLVFLNGFFAAELSSVTGMPKGMFAGSLAEALEEHADLLEFHLARYADASKETFAALNTAFTADGAFLYVPKGAVLEKPVHVLFVSTAGDQPTVSHPRSLVLAEANSQAQVVESYAGWNSEVYFTNSVTEIVAGENAFIDHYKLQRESLEAFHISTIQVQLDRNANVSTQSISMGGALVRNHVNAVLDGEGGEATLNGFYLVNGKQHVDNHTCIEHAKPRCSSREVYKGILDGRARGVFNGRIIVRPDAQKTDSKQTNKNLILSEEALVNTNPQLEIYADDVKCTHGATIGQLDADALFYLRSRGIDLESARHLLTYAFAGDFVNHIKIEPVRAELEKILFAGLAGGLE